MTTPNKCLRIGLLLGLLLAIGPGTGNTAWGYLVQKQAKDKPPVASEARPKETQTQETLFGSSEAVEQPVLYVIKE